MTDDTGLQQRLQAALKGIGWSQRKLAIKAGLGAGAVNDILNHPERSPRAATLLALEQALGLAPGYLTSGAQNGAEVPQTLSAEEIFELEPRNIMAPVAEMVQAAPERWAAVLIPATELPPGSAPGAPQGEIFLVDCAAGYSSGDTVMVRGIAGVGPRLYVEPYLINATPGEPVSYEVRGGAGLEVMGVVTLRIGWR